MEAPAPFIVGVPRSGTTLLRFMLDAHPEVSIPPETGFFPSLETFDPVGADARERFLRWIVATPNWVDFHVDPAALSLVLDTLEPFDVASAVRTFYRVYAARFGKRRWGDKTPVHGPHLASIHRLLPEARFVHLVRDPRDVAASVRGLWFAPGADARSLAEDWRDRILAIRAAAEQIPHYVEIRYEDLIVRTTDVLGRLAEFLELPYDRRMEDYSRGAHLRLAEHEGRFREDGSVLISKAERLRNQRLTTRPPDPTRIGAGRSAWSRDELSVFEAVTGDLLEAFGYDARHPDRAV